MENVRLNNEVICDTSLEIGTPKRYEISFSKRDLRHSSISSDIKHRNYLEYLTLCWDSHLGVIISPDILWNIVLTELATVVKDKPEQYRDLFTDSDEKKTIQVSTTDPVVLPLDLIVEELRNLCPTDVETFIPHFSTTSRKSFLVQYASFADMVSPYYNYAMYRCGISKVRVQGTIEDWQLFNQNLLKLRDLFPKHTTYLNNVSIRIYSIIDSFEKPDVEFFRDIFELQRCGSGGQVEVKGWIRDFFIKTPEVGYVENYSSCVSKVEYKNISTDEDFEMYSGLFSSEISDGYLYPTFGWMVYDK